MSTTARQSEVARYTKQLAALKKQDADEAKKQVAKSKEIERTFSSLRTTKNASSIQNYTRRINSLNGDLAKISEKRSRLLKSISDKTASLHRAEQALIKAQEADQKKSLAAEKRRQQEQLAFHQQITRELQNQVSITSIRVPMKPIINTPDQYDFFISHASEDKDGLVRELAAELELLGLKIWYDESAIKLGDSLRTKIDDGLANSTYAIVVLTPSFFKKGWTNYELDGLLTREMQGNKTIIPIWHQLSVQEVSEYSLSLAGKRALVTKDRTVQDIAQELFDFFSEANSQ